ncbi:MAG: glycoside hydrolase family 3 N-terminal domain-containing protein [bacterium]|nr:glycoside hydrolase family 3 N-terminal domain-containing protein [bacterium]
MMNNRNEQIGQLFVVGFSDETPTPTFLNFLREIQPGGVILFEQNCPSHQAAEENITLIKTQYRDSVPFIAIDQEGGRVCRLRGAPAEYGAAADYARDGNTERYAEEFGRAAVYMESMGINLNLGPVADISLNEADGCLEGRTFGEQPEKVARFVRTAVQISKENKLLSCLKHFPGLGAATQDPHSELASADYGVVLWEQREMIPFLAGVEAGADLIMTTHMKLPTIDDQIVTASSKIISELIRQVLGFEGPIITDELTMKGADSLGHVGERTVKAFNAGHDLLLFGKEFDLALEAYEYFLNACDRKEIDQQRIARSLNRIAGTKFRLAGSVV